MAWASGGQWRDRPTTSAAPPAGCGHPPASRLDDRYAKVLIATAITDSAHAQARFIRNSVIAAKDPAQSTDALKNLAANANADATDAAMARCEQKINTPKGRELFDAMVTARAAFCKDRDEVLRLVAAARAGEQGRGFAVVAGELRSLAQRSAGAAREIKTLIVASVEKVDIGTHQVDEAGASMGEIVAPVQRVGQLIGEISSATAQPSQGVGQIGEAVNELDRVTQQNAALVEESAAAAESPSRQAARLSALVSVFRL